MEVNLLIFFQIATMGLVFCLSYLLLRAVGTPSRQLVPSGEEAKRWKALRDGNAGQYLVLSTILGTLTSLATVYIFFLGNTKIFGFFIFACFITIGLSFFVTKWIGSRINLVECKEADSGIFILSTILSKREGDSNYVPDLVRIISLVSIFSILWLEFSVFADISAKLQGGKSLFVSTAILFASAFLVIFFALKFGLRGFAFADLLQAPFIVIGTFVLFVGVVILTFAGADPSGPAFSLTVIQRSLAPSIPLFICLVFVLSTIFLNMVIVVGTEAHWIRVSLYGRNEYKFQAKSVFAVAFLWAILIGIGFFMAANTEKVGAEAVVEVIGNLANLSPMFAVAFWLAGTAALFSTADFQAYTVCLLLSYSRKTGAVDVNRMHRMQPFKVAFFSAMAFSLLYFTVRKAQIPFEIVIFIVFPIWTNVVPVLVARATGRPARAEVIFISLMLYGVCSAMSVIDSANGLFWAVLAPSSAAVVTVGQFVFLQKARSA